MKILICEPERHARTALVAICREHGHAVERCSKGEDALDHLAVTPFDIVVMACDLADMAGVKFILETRKKRFKTPIIVLLSMEKSTPELAALLYAGADDVMAKPFHADELMARVGAITRRCADMAEPTVTIGPMTFNTESLDLAVDGTRIYLSGTEAQFLAVLVRQRGMFVPNERFMSALYSGEDEPQGNIVRVYMCRLRKKFTDAGLHPTFIQNSWGRGYMLPAEM